MKTWENKVDNRYDVFVEATGDGYKGFLVVMDGEKELLREETTISYAARFGPDMSDVAQWEQRCLEVIDGKKP